MTLHIPTIAKSLKDMVLPQIRLGIQGPPASGKTTSALTAPNPIVVDFDRGLTNFAGREDILTIPFWDEEFINGYEGGKFKRKNTSAQHPNRRDALLHFLKHDGLKMKPEQTLILDSWSSIQDAFDAQQELEPKITKTGEIDDYHFWTKKIDFSKEVMAYINSVPCHVIVLFHENPSRDAKTGQLLDKIQPLMQGKFVCELKRFFTDFFRMINDEKKNKDGIEQGCTYYWQIKSSPAFDARTRLIVPDEVYRVEPHWNIFSQYKRRNP